MNVMCSDICSKLQLSARGRKKTRDSCYDESEIVRCCCLTSKSCCRLLSRHKQEEMK